MFTAISRLSLLILFVAACDRGATPPEPSPADAPVVAEQAASADAAAAIEANNAADAPQEQAPADDAADAPQEQAPADDAAAAIEADNAAPELGAGANPAAGERVAVRAIRFREQDFPSELPDGLVHGGFAFVDSAGTNYVVFTKYEPLRVEHVRNSVLRIKHVVTKDGVTREVRSYIERIADCDFDIILEPFYGDWSVSDVDNNGIGEASFAYTADCVSDVSPRKHKAFVTEGGEKYVLRGRSVIVYSDSNDTEGGEFRADRMPPLFLQKAKLVWERTSRK